MTHIAIRRVPRRAVRAVAAAVARRTTTAGRAVTRAAVEAARHAAWEARRNRSKNDPSAWTLLSVFAVVLAGLFFLGVALGAS